MNPLSFPRVVTSPAGALLALLALDLWTARAAADDSVRLPAVVVTAPPGDHPLTVTVNPRVPAQPIPAQDGAEALRAIPGFTVIRKGGTDGDPVLRGMAGSRLGILLDGANLLGGCDNRMDPPTAYIFPAVYDQVTVLKGPQSVLHGPGNTAGVVLFERTTRRRAAPTAGAEVSLVAGSFGRQDELLHASAGTETGYVETSLTRTAADDYEDGSGRAVSSAYRRWSMQAAVAWTPAEHTFVEVTAARSDGEAAYADRTMDGAAFARDHVGLRTRIAHVSPLVSAINADVYLNRVDHVMDNFSLRTFTPTMMMPGRTVANPERLTYGGRVSLTLTPGAGWTTTVGADYQGNRHRSRSSGDQAVTPYETLTRRLDATFAAAAVFAEATYAPQFRRRLIGGVRLDAWDAKDHRATVATGMGSTAPNPTRETTRSASWPAGFLRYEHDLRPATTLSLAFGQARRFPDYWELFGKESADSVSAFATRAERINQLDAGLTHRAGRLAASVSLFANRVDDSILIQGGVVKPAGMMGTRTATIARNVDTASHGGEVSVGYRLTPRWRADASAAYVRGENRTDGLPLAQQPPLEGRLGLGYTAPTWSVGSLVRLVGAQDRFARNQGNIVGQDLGASTGFTVFSLNAAWSPAGWGQLAVGVDNLLDRTYAEHLSRAGSQVAGYPVPTTRVNEPGRNLWASLKLRW